MTAQAKSKFETFLEALDDSSKEKLFNYLTGSFSERVGIGPELMQKVVQKARIHAETGNAEEAFEVFGAAVILEPMNMTYLGGLANCALLLGLPDPALHAASLMTVIEPENPVGYALSGAACRLMGKYEEAAEDFADAHRLALSSGNLAVAGLVDKLQAGLPG